MSSTPQGAGAGPAHTPPVRRWAVNLSLALGSLLLTLAFSEIALRYVIKPRAVITRQILAGFGVSEAEQLWQRHPQLGWIIKPAQRFRHVNPAGEFDVEVRTGPRGVRVPLAGGEPAENAARRILFVGDSVTAAYEVDYPETFVAKVERSLAAGGQRVQCINAGVRGYSSGQSLVRMRDLLDELPGIDDVVYLYSLNDPFENMSVHFPKRLMMKPAAYLDAAGKLDFFTLPYELGVLDAEAVFVGPQRELGVLPVIGWRPSRQVVENRLRLRKPKNIWERLYLYSLAAMAVETYLLPEDDLEAVRARYPYVVAEYIADSEGGFSPGFIDISWEPGSYPLDLLEAIVVEMHREATRRGSRFWLALPYTAQSQAVAFFREVAERHGIRLIDPVSAGRVQPWVDKCGGRLVFRTDGHYSPCGHSAQAEILLAALAAPEQTPRTRQTSELAAGGGHGAASGDAP